MTEDVAGDPLLRQLSALATLTPRDAHTERVCDRSHALLARRRHQPVVAQKMWPGRMVTGALSLVAVVYLLVAVGQALAMGSFVK